jgi:hypothetical protein
MAFCCLRAALALRGARRGTPQELSIALALHVAELVGFGQSSSDKLPHAVHEACRQRHVA